MVEITDSMIDSHIAWNKAEYNEDMTREEAWNELDKLRAKGCTLCEDCRSCPKFGKACPI